HGADREPVAGSAARVRPGAPLHQPRSRHRRAHDPSCCGHVSRQDRRARSEEKHLRRAQASLYRGAALRRADARARGGAQAHHSQRGCAEPEQSAQGLPFSHPLPLRLSSLSRGGARIAINARGGVRRLSLARSPAGAKSFGCNWPALRRELRGYGALYSIACFARTTTAAGVAKIFSASACNSSPEIGSMTTPILCASASRVWSRIVCMNAVRSAATRSPGTPGGIM